MILIYILLGIIAVGVLLVSDAGKNILEWLILIALVASGLYLVFLIVVLALGSSDNLSLQYVWPWLIVGLIGIIYEKNKKNNKEIKKNENDLNNIWNKSSINYWIAWSVVTVVLVAIAIGLVFIFPH